MKFGSFVIAALLVLPALAENAPAPTPAGPSRVAVLRFQDAVLSTQEGRQAAAALKAKFDPRKAQLEKRQQELQAEQKQLETGTATLSADARAKLQEEVARGSRDLQRAADDLNTDVQTDENRMMQELATKMSDVIHKYATANGYTMVLDVSSQQTPVLWAAAGANISADIVKAYDAAHPVHTAAAAPAPKATASK